MKRIANGSSMRMIRNSSEPWTCSKVSLSSLSARRRQKRKSPREKRWPPRSSFAQNEIPALVCCRGAGIRLGVVMPLLAFETSCDETSVAVVHDARVLSNVVSSQVKLHGEYGGVVPELAAREHLKNLMPTAEAALSEAKVNPDQLEAVAATQGPGLPSALMAGLKAAQACAFSLRRPLFGIHHHEAHLYSPWIEGNPPIANFSEFQPNVSLIVSGGHTILVHVESELKHQVLGCTVDDAAGECFDKAGKLMGLPYPAG